MVWPLSLRTSAMLPVVLAAFGLLVHCGTPAEPPAQPLERRFTDIVQPFLKTYCLACHGTKKHEAKLDLSGYTSPAIVAKNEHLWERIAERLEAEEMPPEQAPRKPRPHE